MAKQINSVLIFTIAFTIMVSGSSFAASEDSQGQSLLDVAFEKNDIEMAAYAEPSLSSVGVNRYLMGSRAMELIIERLQINDTGTQTEYEADNTQRPNNDKSIRATYINTGFKLIMRKSTR